MDYLQAILDNGEERQDVKSFYAFETFTAEFDNDLEVDVKVCNGRPPYVDSIMFKNGYEVSVTEVSERLLGGCWFD